MILMPNLTAPTKCKVLRAIQSYVANDLYITAVVTLLLRREVAGFMSWVAYPRVLEPG